MQIELEAIIKAIAKAVISQFVLFAIVLVEVISECHGPAMNMYRISPKSS